MSELVSILNRGGYHTHVFTYTIRALVNSIDSISSTGIKTLLALLFPMALSQDKKEEFTFASKMTESNPKNIQLIFERLTQIASDIECFEVIRNFFHDRFNSISNSKQRTIVSQIVEHCSVGLGKNSNLSLQSLLSISFVLLDEEYFNEFFVALSLGNLKQLLKRHEVENENSIFPFLKILPEILIKLADHGLTELALSCICLLYKCIQTKTVWYQAIGTEKIVLHLFGLTSNVNPNSAEMQKIFNFSLKIISLLILSPSHASGNDYFEGGGKISFQDRIKGLVSIISSNGISRYENEIKSILNFFLCHHFQWDNFF